MTQQSDNHLESQFDFVLSKLSSLECVFCTVSKTVYRKEKSLIRHIWTKHFTELLAAKSEPQVENPNLQPLILKCVSLGEQIVAKYKHVCSICEEVFSRKTHLLGHLQQVHRPKVKMSANCEACGMGYLSFTKHNQSCGKVLETKHVCELCGRVLTTRSNLARHVKGHTSMSSYICDTCGKKFKDKFRLKLHKKLHTGEKPFICTYCERGFASKNTLVDHIRTHTNERPFKCDACDKGFTQRSALKTHRLTQHTSNKPFECENCFDVFSTRRSLKTHNCAITVDSVC